MDPLSAVEDLLGEVECWPTYVIYNMFVEELSPTSVKKIAAFMYGNSIPIENAVQCFIACNGLNTSFVSQNMNDWYCVWDKNHYKIHKAKYYSTF
jgi:hypothetical protein